MTNRRRREPRWWYGGDVHSLFPDARASHIPAIMTTRVIARLAPSLARRVLASGAIGGLGGVMLWLAASHPAPTFGLVSGLVVLAALCFVAAVLVWQATSIGLVLTEAELRDTRGRQLFGLDEVQQIEKGVLHWKPAGGFAVVLNAPKPRIWVPGLWWRFGRRVMVGGATNGGEAKAMADLMRDELDRQREG